MLSPISKTINSSPGSVERILYWWGTIEHGSGFEKVTTRSTYLRVESLYYHGTLFLEVKIFMWQFLLHDLKHIMIPNAVRKLKK